MNVLPRFAKNTCLRFYVQARKCAGKEMFISFRSQNGAGAWRATQRDLLQRLRQRNSYDHTQLELTDDDLVVFRPRMTQITLAPSITLPEWAEDKARSIAREKGRDYYAMRTDWLTFAQSETAKGNPPQNTGAAFLAWAKKLVPLR